MRFSFLVLIIISIGSRGLLGLKRDVSHVITVAKCEGIPMLDVIFHMS